MLTPSETKTLKFIQKYCIEKGCSPTLTEIANGIGIKSRGVVHRYIRSLESKITEQHPIEKEVYALILKPRTNPCSHHSTTGAYSSWATDRSN